MSLENDHEPCAVLIRPSGKKVWSLQCFTLRKSVAWRTAEILREGERDSFMVILRDDYDRGKLKPLKPPPGFKLLDGQEPYVDPHPFDPVITIAKPKVVESSTETEIKKPGVNRYGVGVECDRYFDKAEKSKKVTQLGKEMLGLDI